jgi:cytochrome c oxidase assembly protein subunit 15
LLTAVAVFGLLLLGAVVTSLRAGMVDPQSVREPWYLVKYALDDQAQPQGVGYLVEHGHRQLGWMVGLMTIILAALIMIFSRRTWLKVTAGVALLGVSLQGVLGILRVELNRAGFGLELAMVHGVTGQLVFAVMGVLPLALSRGWLEGVPVAVEGGARFRKMCRLTTLLLLLQLGVGVWLRHQGSGPGWAILITHAVLAVAILSHAAMLVIRARRAGLRDAPGLKAPAMWVLLLVLAQMGVGTAAWWFGAGEGTLDYRQVTVERAVLPTLHVGIGALILMTTVLLTLRSYRVLELQSQPRPAPVGIA